MTPAQIGQQFGQRLRLVRQARGLSAQQLADLVPLSESQIRQRERGGRGVTLPDAVVLCAALDVSLEAMVAPEFNALRVLRTRAAQ